jgi:hypothetical protein
MSNRINYGRRYSGGSAAGGKVGYNESDDRARRADYGMFAALARQPLHKRELRAHQTGLACKKAAGRRAPGPEREESERRMAEAVRKCVEILEFHMEDMIQHRKVAGRPHYCAQLMIHNVIVELRSRCGVSFTEHNPHYEERQNEDSRRRNAREWKSDLDSEREQQRLSRTRNMREVAERFARMHNKARP